MCVWMALTHSRAIAFLATLELSVIVTQMSVCPIPVIQMESNG